MSIFSPAFRYTLIVSLGGFIFGFDASVISGTVGFVVSEFNLTTLQQGLVVSAPTLGAILSTLTAGAICDAIGRRKVLLAIAFLYLLSAIASAFAASYEMLVLARFVGGLAFCSLMIAPMYIAEISSAETRGKMVSVNQLNIMLGFSAAYFANYYILQLSGSELGWVQSLGLDEYTWRWMLGIEALPALLYFLMLFGVPESPRWLLLKQRPDAAKAVLGKLNSPALAEAQMVAIQDTLEEQTPPLLERVKTLFSPALKFALLIGIIVGIAQQITGINAVYFYAPSIFEQSGVGTNAAFMQAIWIGIINIIFTLLAMALIDKIGRKPLLVMGLAGVLISMSVCAYGFKQATYMLTDETVAELNEQVDTEVLQPLVGQTFDNDLEYKHALIALLGEQTFNANQAALIKAAANMNAVLILAGILGFVASFAISLGPVMWVLFSEIFPNQIRGIAISFVGIINSIVSFGVQFMFPWELANLGNALTFLIYGLFALLGLVLVVWLIPETKGKTLEQLETELSGDNTKLAGFKQAGEAL